MLADLERRGRGGVPPLPSWAAAPLLLEGEWRAKLSTLHGQLLVPGRQGSWPHSCSCLISLSGASADSVTLPFCWESLHRGHPAFSLPCQLYMFSARLYALDQGPLDPRPLGQLSPFSWPSIFIWGVPEHPPWVIQHCTAWAHSTHSPNTPHPGAFRFCWHSRVQLAPFRNLEASATFFCAPRPRSHIQECPSLALCESLSPSVVSFSGEGADKPPLVASPSPPGWFQWSSSPWTWERGSTPLRGGGSSFLSPTLHFPQGWPFSSPPFS